MDFGMTPRRVRIVRRDTRGRLPYMYPVWISDLPLSRLRRWRVPFRRAKWAVLLAAVTVACDVAFRAQGSRAFEGSMGSVWLGTFGVVYCAAAWCGEKALLRRHARRQQFGVAHLAYLLLALVPAMGCGVLAASEL